MAIKVSKNPGLTRVRRQPLSVVVSADEPDLGAVGVTLCEIPPPLFEDLHEEIRATERELEERSIGLEKAREGKAPAEEIAQLQRARSLARQRLTRQQLEAIRWGVCDHQAEDFLDEGGGPYPFESAQVEMDGVRYRVASDSTLSAYASIGAPFLLALYASVIRWQSSRKLTPEEVWAAAKDLKELQESAVRKLFNERVEQLMNGGASTENKPKPEKDKFLA